MSPIQRDGIHAYILLPREFKRQCRSSCLKAIQSLFFLFPPISFWAIKFKNSNVHYNLGAVALSILLRCCALCPLTFFFSRSGKVRLQHCFFFWWRNLRTLYVWHDFAIDGVCQVLWLWVSFWLGWAAGVTGILAQSDSLVREPTTSHLA